jgi:hypothetical protein
MSATSFLLLSTAALSSAALFAIPSRASAADVSVYAYGPRPVLVAPAPRVYVAPARTVVVAPRCVTRSARIWVAGRYVYRAVRTCT